MKIIFNHYKPIKHLSVNKKPLKDQKPNTQHKIIIDSYVSFLLFYLFNSLNLCKFAIT